MARKFCIAAVVVFAALGLVAAALGSAYWAMSRVRPFYAEALRLDPHTLDAGSRELESRATALFSEARQVGAWQAAFTADQINGWLALKLDEFYGDSLGREMSDPRVAIEGDRFTLGFRGRQAGVDTIISADATVILTERGEIAVRLLSVEAGALPLPVMQIADEISLACQRLELPVRWTQDAGKPVALVDVNQDATQTRRFHVDAIELRDGALFVAGRTMDISEIGAQAGKEARPETAQADDR